MSPSFGRIDPALLLPAHMDIDWIRVYQPRGSYNVGCDPPEMPTLKYINECVLASHLRAEDSLTDAVRSNIEAYTNPNLTVFSDMKGSPQFPGNRLLGQCLNE